VSDDPALKCVRCQSDLVALGQESLVTGGASAGAKFFLGQLAEMQEKNWVVSAYRCPSCHHVELFLPDGP
jgi:hypothetical protein